MQVAGASRPGRGHRTRGIPCQDSHAAWQDPAGGRAVAAVADGLGSCPLSDAGSRAAVDAAVAALAAEPTWDEAAVVRAFEAARAAIEAEAAQRGVPVNDLSTTLQLAALDGSRLWAGMVGDGAIVAGSPKETDSPDPVAPAGASGFGESVLQFGKLAVRIVLAPAPSGYANEVVPVTSALWRASLRVTSMDGVRAALVFTDGLTRLLLTRSRDGWSPFSPFFDSFLPRLAAAPPAEAVEALVQGDEVDRAWDDDKCLVVLTHGP